MLSWAASFFLSPLIRHIDAQGDDHVGKKHSTENNCLPVGDHCTAHFRSEKMGLSRITRKSGLLCKDASSDAYPANGKVKYVCFRGANYGTRLHGKNTQEVYEQKAKMYRPRNRRRSQARGRHHGRDPHGDAHENCGRLVRSTERLRPTFIRCRFRRFSQVCEPLLKLLLVQSPSLIHARSGAPVRSDSTSLRGQRYLLRNFGGHARRMFLAISLFFKPAATRMVTAN